MFRCALLLPKLLVDSVLCFCALAVTPLNILLHENNSIHTTLEFRSFYRRFYDHIDVPFYFFPSKDDQKKRNYTLLRNDWTNNRVRLILPLAAEKIFHVNWRLAEMTSMFVNDRFVIGSRLMLLAIDLSKDGDAYDPFTPFSKLVLTVNDGEEIYRFRHSDVYWILCGDIAWYFVPLSNAWQGVDRFAALHGDVPHELLHDQCNVQFRFESDSFTVRDTHIYTLNV